MKETALVIMRKLTESARGVYSKRIAEKNEENVRKKKKQTKAVNQNETEKSDVL